MAGLTPLTKFDFISCHGNNVSWFHNKHAGFAGDYTVSDKALGHRETNGYAVIVVSVPSWLLWGCEWVNVTQVSYPDFVSGFSVETHKL
jgi:hypothetical protein